MTRIYSEDDYLDEDDVKVRPNPRGSRPRTKRRPNFDDAPLGMVLEVHLARYRVLVDGKEVLATLAKELRNKGCVTCDQVRLAGDLTGEKGSLARIVKVEPRSTALSRLNDESEAGEQTIVANADQLMIVLAAANPEPKARLVDRYLVAAYNAGIKPFLVMTKCDLQDPSEFLESFSGFDLTVIKTRSDKPNLEQLIPHIKGHTTVFAGHSGVGKTTLINALAPNYSRATQEVNEVTGKGKHTSSSARAISAHAGWIVDTPGVRTFGLAGINSAGLLKGFTDLAKVSESCPRDCSHLESAPDCELDVAASKGEISELRLDSFRRLVAEVGSVDWS
ncbi:MAG: ribosome small subunit-dependent GTPase A [Actinobacteria bacterium]|nr:ribosome small subunit-dependent GTPase A [Actinomycetota bacterium]